VSAGRSHWQPVDGERVRVIGSGRTGTVVHRTLTEWGWLCDVLYDATSERRTYTVSELEPLDAPPHA